MQTSQPTVAARRMQGFTLIETMFVVSIAAIILAIAVPSMGSFVRNHRMTGAANDMLASIYLARAEAIKRHARTVVCFSADPTATTPSCNGTGQEGWIVFVDDNNPAAPATTDNNGIVDTGEPVIARHGPFGPGITPTFLPSTHDGYVSYNATGYARSNPLGDMFTTIVLCDSRGNVATYGDTHSAARSLSLSNSGRPAITRVVSDIENLGGCP